MKIGNFAIANKEMVMVLSGIWDKLTEFENWIICKNVYAYHNIKVDNFNVDKIIRRCLKHGFLSNFLLKFCERLQLLIL